MVLVGEGTGEDIEGGHVDYYTGEVRPVTHSQNMIERFINPELTVEERHRITARDSNRRNKYTVSLFCEKNTQILEDVSYNPFTEALSLSWHVTGCNIKRLLDVSGPEIEKGNEYLKRDMYKIHLLGGSNTQIIQYVQYNPFTEEVSFSWQVTGHHGKRLLDITEA